MQADETELRALYQGLLEAWQQRDGAAFAAKFMEDGHAIGYDGSEHHGRAGIASDLNTIFAAHATPTYVSRIREVRLLGSGAAVVRAAAGLVPPGETDINPAINAWQTMVAMKVGGGWQIVLFQNTPAQFHGRPQLAEALSAELREELNRPGAL